MTILLSIKKKTLKSLLETIQPQNISAYILGDHDDAFLKAPSWFPKKYGLASTN